MIIQFESKNKQREYHICHKQLGFVYDRYHDNYFIVILSVNEEIPVAKEEFQKALAHSLELY